MGGAIGHCRHLVHFRLAQNDHLYLVKIMDGFMDHEPVKIIFFYLCSFYQIQVEGLSPHFRIGC